MKILFLAPNFYGYCSHVYNYLVQDGNDVDLVNYPDSFLFRLVTTLGGLYCKPAERMRANYFSKLKRSLDNHYDCIFAIRGSDIPDFFYYFLKEKYPNARYIQYLWDDVSLDPRSLDTVKYYDKILSFNPADCKQYGFVFRPFFYNESIPVKTENKDIDIMMIGSYTERRFTLLKQLDHYIKQYRINSLIIIRASIFLFLTKFEHIPYRRYFRSKGISYTEMLQLLGRSKSCIEICYEGQNGLSTRQFEALYTRTKVITNNKNVVDYDFYHPDNIFVFNDEKDFQVPTEWIMKPYHIIPNNILRKYSLERFMADIMS